MNNLLLVPDFIVNLVKQLYLLFVFTCLTFAINLNSQSACPQNLTVSSGPIADGTYAAKNAVNSDYTIPSSGSVTFKAGNCVELDPGFELEAMASFQALIEECCDDATILNGTCFKIIETIGANKIGVVDLSQANATINYDGCSPSALSLSFSNTNPNVTSFIVDCAHAANPGGLVPGGYTIYLWNTLTNTVIDYCNNFLQVLDGGAYCN